MPTTSAPFSGESPFVCDFPGCDSRYRRKEHLKRHQMNHQGHASVACPNCNQKLTRKKVSSFGDLLRRHIRKYHPESQLPPSRALKACTACRRRKEICEGGSPCKACERRRLDCSLVSQSSPIRRPHDLNESRLASLEIPSTDDYVGSYFQHFHPEWPFLFRSTFDPATEPGVLVQSVVMLGMWAYGSSESKNMAINLHRRLGYAIKSQRSQWDYSSVDSDETINITWPITTYQSVLLHVILSVFITRDTGGVDLGLRHRIPADEYDLFESLIRSCRNLGMFSYPAMLSQYPTGTPVTMIWVGVEEMKRFALALYKMAHICTSMERKETICQKPLTVADFSFSLPYSDEFWNLPKEVDARPLVKAIAQTSQDEDRDHEKWINSSFTTLHDDRVSFKWI